MSESAVGNRPLGKALVYSIGFALLWVVLAAIQPSTTYHLAPLLVSLAPPVTYRLQGGTSRSVGLQLAVAGMAIALVITALLAVGGWLEGPSLLPTGGASLETLIGAITGGVAGFGVAAWPRAAETT